MHKSTTHVLVSLAQLVGTMHKICKIRGSNSGHYQKTKVQHIYLSLINVKKYGTLICHCGKKKTRTYLKKHKINKFN